MSWADSGLHLSDDDSPSTRWAGFIVFAGFLLALGGVLQLIAGLTAVFDDGYFAVDHRQLAVHLSYTAWGWIHVAFGAVLLTVGSALSQGQRWARGAAIAVASLSLIANFLFLAAYPPWGIFVIAFDVIVIYAVAVHWDELRQR